MKIYKSYFLFNRCWQLVFLISLQFIFQSCANKTYPLQTEQYSFKSVSGLPDYKYLDYWAANPGKKNPSDSVSAALSSSYSPTKSVDVFFIHPTTFTDSEDSSWNAAIDNAAINQKTDMSSILYQASVFNESCRIFAPRYRQAHIRAFFTDKTIAAPYFDIAYQDVKAAFQYYLEYQRNGRPFIIASHSQGTLHAARLLKEFVEGKKLQEQLVCAYIIGLPVSDNYFSILKPCSDSLSTGCIVSWRTYLQGYEPEFVEQEKFKAIVINPLTWTNTTDEISSSENKGGILKNFNKVVPHVVSAQVHGNILWTSKPHIFGKFLLRTKNYHIGDINLFYMNIRNNVRTRINSYQKNYKP